MPHPDYPNSDVQVVRQRLLDGMVEYMQSIPQDCGYRQTDIDHCFEIVDQYLTETSGPSARSPDRLRDAVKTTVLELNALNERCGHSLIETDQREYLCELILVTAKGAGLDTDEDITEEWREW